MVRSRLGTRGTSRRLTTDGNIVREHFSSPLLQFAETDGGKTFTLVECPSMSFPTAVISFPDTNNLHPEGGTGQLISRLTNDEIDIAM